MSSFTQFNLPQNLQDALGRMQITAPTPIQEAAIPVALEGHDILASAQTGSGKTIAFALPLIIKLMNDPTATAMILAPTRELAMQVNQTLNKLLGGFASFKTALLIGGAPMFRQISELKRRPRIIVGTPGRINDHLDRGTLRLKETRFLVVDEADRMLDMGFGIQLDQIAEYLPRERQTLMFSATVPPNIEKLTKKYLNNHQRISIAASMQAAPKIKQEIVQTTSSEKLNVLLDHLNQRQGSIIIFVKTRRGADKLCKQLQDYGHTSDSIHGDLKQSRRDRVIQSFRAQKSRILVATDVAARGLDIPHVMHVINYNLPECPEDYIHRIGRTARAGAEGNALCLISSEDVHKWSAIRRLLEPEVAKSLHVKSEGHAGTRGGQRQDQGRFRRGPFKKFKAFAPRKKSFGSRKAQRGSQRTAS